jgi:tricorn protease-like protein
MDPYGALLEPVQKRSNGLADQKGGPPPAHSLLGSAGRSRLVVVVAVLGFAALVLITPTTGHSASTALRGKIVFDDDGADAWSVNADGSSRRRLTSDPAPEFDPSWSPDGTKIAYRSEVMNLGGNGNSEIYVMNADGSEQVNLTRDPAQDYSPAWSPDGRTISFASDRGARSTISTS